MSKIDLTNLNKVDTDLILPSTSENISLQKSQENKWGNILNNQTFNTLNNNIKLLKNSLVETINTLNNENTTSKNKYINDDNNIVSLGDSTKKLNFLTTQIQVNGVDTEFLTTQNLPNISNIVYKNKENTFTYPLNTNQYNINSNQVIVDDNSNINIGNNQRKLNLQSSDGKLYLNGQEFKGGNNNVENENIYTEKKLYGKDVDIILKLSSLTNINKSNINDNVFGIKEFFRNKYNEFNIFSGNNSLGVNLYQKREYTKDEQGIKTNKLTLFSENFKFLNELLFDIENGNNRSIETDKLKCIKFNLILNIGNENILNENVSLYKVFTNNNFSNQYQGPKKTDPIFLKNNLIVDRDGWEIPFIIPINQININNDDNLKNFNLYFSIFYNYKLFNETQDKLPKNSIYEGVFFEFAMSKYSKSENYIENFPILFKDNKTFENISRNIIISFRNIEKIYTEVNIYDIEKIKNRAEIYTNK